MRVLIHACPPRMWYVSDFLVPELKKQGAENVEIWNDTEKRGNLASCMACFAAQTGDGGTWHIQDDVLLCSDFVRRCEQYDEGLVYGFTCRNFNDRLDAAGWVYSPDAWNSFQCVRIPDQYARECAEWVRTEAWRTESDSYELPILWRVNKGDDTFFHEFIKARHPAAECLNLKPNIVEHVDWLVGGSAINYRDYIARAEFFEEQDRVNQLEEQIKRYKGDYQ